jgi:flagellar basal body-associated protein FliL
MAEEKNAAEKDAKEAAPAGPKMIMGMTIPVFAFVAVNVLVMCGALAFIVHASLIYKKPAITDAQVEQEITKVEQKKAVDVGQEFITISYPETVVTLRGEQGGKTRYATIETTIVCGSEACKAQIDENRAKVEDAIQSVVGARSYTELSSLETKFRVKHEILTKVNSFLKDTAALDMLFTSFLIQ